MKFIASYYDKSSGTSYVTIQHLGKKFEGIAKISPDSEFASEYAGCEYAEIRATIKALKYERNKIKEETEICRKFVKSIECYSKFNKEDESAKSIYKQLAIRIKKVNDITDDINKLLHILDYKIHAREKTLKIIHNLKNN